MTIIDIAILVVIVLSAFIGTIRGFTRELLGLVSWVGASVLALLSLPALRHIARGYITSPMLADVVTVFVSFVALLIAFNIISHVIAGFVKDSGLGALDRFLGLGFGLMRGVLIISIMEIGLSFFVGRPNYPQPVQMSKFGPVLINVSDRILALIPQHIMDSLRAYVPKLPTPTVPLSLGPLQPQGQAAITQATPSLPSALSPHQVTPPAVSQDATVDALAKLKPQANISKSNEDGSYQETQRLDMDRLIQTTE